MIKKISKMLLFEILPVSLIIIWIEILWFNYVTFTEKYSLSLWGIWLLSMWLFTAILSTFLFKKEDVLPKEWNLLKKFFLEIIRLFFIVSFIVFILVKLNFSDSFKNIIVDKSLMENVTLEIKKQYHILPYKLLPKHFLLIPQEKVIKAEETFFGDHFNWLKKVWEGETLWYYSLQSNSVILSKKNFKKNNNFWVKPTELLNHELLHYNERNMFFKEPFLYLNVIRPKEEKLRKMMDKFYFEHRIENWWDLPFVSYKLYKQIKDINLYYDTKSLIILTEYPAHVISVYDYAYDLKNGKFVIKPKVAKELKKTKWWKQALQIFEYAKNIFNNYYFK